MTKILSAIIEFILSLFFKKTDKPKVEQPVEEPKADQADEPQPSGPFPIEMGLPERPKQDEPVTQPVEPRPSIQTPAKEPAPSIKVEDISPLPPGRTKEQVMAEKERREEKEKLQQRIEEIEARREMRKKGESK